MRAMLLRVFLALIVACGPSTRLCGGESASPATQVDVSAEQIQALLNQLGAPRYQERRRAFLDLWKSGATALPAVHAAQRNENPQIAQSAKVLEILLKLDLDRGDEDNVALLLQLLAEPTPFSIVELCRREYWNVATEFLDADPELVAQFEQPNGSFHLARILEMALEQDEPQLAWPLVRRLVSVAEASWIAKQNGFAPPEIDETDPRQVVERDFFSGEIDAAIQGNISQELRIRFIARGARWSQLADAGLQRAIAEGGSVASQQATQAVLYELAGNLRAGEQAWEELFLVDNSHVDNSHVDNSHVDNSHESQRAEGVGDIDPRQRAAVEILKQDRAPGPLVLALLMSGQVKTIEQYLLETAPDHAFNFLLSNSKFAEAFQVVGLDADLANFEPWLAARRLLILEQDTTPYHFRYQESARLCNALINLGYSDQAKQLLSTLVEIIDEKSLQSQGGAMRVQSQWGLWRNLGLRLSRSEARQALRVEVERKYRDIPKEVQSTVLESLFPDFEHSAVALLDTAPASVLDPQTPPAGQGAFARKWKALENLWLLNREYFGDNASQIVGDWLNRARATLATDADGEQLSELAHVAFAFGLTDQALDLATDPVAGDLTHFIDAADYLLERGMPKLASQHLEQYRSSYRFKHQYDMLGKEIDALLLAGDFDQAEVLSQFRNLLPLDAIDRNVSYASVAAELQRREEFEQAALYAVPGFLLAESRRISSYLAAATFAACLDELDHYRQSADVRRAIFVEMLHPSSDVCQRLVLDPTAHDYLGYMNYSLQKERLSRAISCIEEADFEAAIHHAEVGRRMQPQDIEMAVECVPRLIAAGRERLANDIFDRFEATMLEQIEKWPRDATALNNLAWMYSQCDRKLDEALELAQQAVAQAPSSGVFLDTLAEVQFRMGDIDAALESVRGCIQLDPRDSHYRQNLIRMRGKR